MGDKKAKAGWGFGGKNNEVNIDLTNKIDDKQNIWEQNNEDLIIIPDMDQELEEQKQYEVSKVGAQAHQKVTDLTQIENLTQMTTLPQTEEDVDLSYLMGFLRPVEEIRENDEQWEFIKLKTDIYELVTNLYRPSNFQEESEDEEEEENQAPQQRPSQNQFQQQSSRQF